MCFSESESKSQRLLLIDTQAQQQPAKRKPVCVYFEEGREKERYEASVAYPGDLSVFGAGTNEIYHGDDPSLVGLQVAVLFPTATRKSAALALLCVCAEDQGWS